MSLTSYRTAPPRGFCRPGKDLSIGQDLLCWVVRCLGSGFSGLWPFRTLAFQDSGLSGLWPFRTLAFQDSGLSGLWPFRTLAFQDSGLSGPGGDLLSHALRRSTIGAEGFHGRVRDGIGCVPPRHDHQVLEGQSSGVGCRRTDVGCRMSADRCRRSELRHSCDP